MTGRRRRRAAGWGGAVALVLATVAALGCAPAGAGELPAPHHPPDEVRRVVHDVLARPEYRRDAPSPFDRARTWVRDEVGRLLSSLFRGGRGTVLAWAILGGLLVVVIVLSARFARSMAPDPGRELTAHAPPRRSAHEWRAEAEALERAQEWKPALRARYRALVADLGERGVLDEVPGRTAGEYRAAVGAAAPRVATEFSGATELFERAWYGSRPTGADDAARFRDLEQHVLTGTRA